MITIADQAVFPVVRRGAEARLRRAASVAVDGATTVAAGLLRRLEAIRDAGQLGADYETEVGRWTGARI